MSAKDHLTDLAVAQDLDFLASVVAGTWARARPDVRQALDAAYALGGWEAGAAVWRGYDAERLAQGGAA